MALPGHLCYLCHRPCTVGPVRWKRRSCCSSLWARVTQHKSRSATTQNETNSLGYQFGLCIYIYICTSIYIYIHACIQFRITTFIGSIETVKICTDPSLPWGHHGRVTIHARTQRPVWLLVIQPAKVQILPLFTLGWPKDKDNNLDKDLVFDMVCGWTVPKTRIFYEFCGSPLCCFHGSLVGKLLTWDGQSMRWRVHIEGVGIKQLGGVEVFHGE